MLEEELTSYEMENKDTSSPEVTIEKWVYGGAGLGRWNGQVVLAPYTLPGETVRFAVARRRPDVLNVRVTEMVQAAPERVEAGCRYFGRCGGCQYQHAGYEFQVARKREILRETLRRVGKLEAPAEIGAVTGEPWGYRNRSQFHVKGSEIGFLGAESHTLVPAEECPISSPKINEVLKTLRKMAKDRRWPDFLRTVELFSNETETMVNVTDTVGGKRVARSFFDWCAAGIRGAAAGEVKYAALGETFRVSHGSFFQVNRFLVDALVGEALEGAEGAAGLDLYAGVGLFAIPMARRLGRVEAVESSGAAVRDLEANAAAAGVEVKAHRANTEEFLAGLSEAPEYVLADPPRTGLGKVVVEHLVRLRAPRVTLVACDPATLARDLAGLVAGGYRMETLTLVDLFPQTFHMEAVAKLRLE